MMSRILILVFSVCFIISHHIYQIHARTLHGGYRHPIAIDDPMVQTAARWAANELGGGLISVQQAEVQIVAGLMFYIDLTIMTHSKQVKVCHVKIWVQEWRQFRKLMPGSTCSSENTIHRFMKTLEFSRGQ